MSTFALFVPNPGDSQDSSGHIATRMIVAIARKEYDTVVIFTNERFENSFEYHNVNLLKCNQPFLENELFIVRTLGLVVFQLTLCWNLFTRRKEIDIAVFGGWTLLAPAIVCNIADITSVHRLAGNPLKSATRGKPPESINLKVKRTLASLVLKSFVNIVDIVAPIEMSLIGRIGLNRASLKVCRWNHYFMPRSNFDKSAVFDNRDIDIGFVGYLNYTKGADKIIDAYECMVKEYPDMRIALAGDGPLYDEFVSEHLPNINVLGHVDRTNLNNLYNRMKILLVPSRFEGFPKVIVEAGLCGTIPVVTNVGGIKDVIIHNENGIVVDNYTSLCKCLLTVLSNGDLSSLSSKVYEHFDSKYRKLHAHDRFVRFLDCIHGEGKSECVPADK
ncbi:glycosyltransferase family 4 protein [Salinibacter ruber]|uniref:glycosyltransferase family 4 protein n=1 Tax=Salinibacter ruber TaxID=146919 RepID=UPI000E586EFB|nr:glycosyltransferase [Salinibacter ruber]